MEHLAVIGLLVLLGERPPAAAESAGQTLMAAPHMCVVRD